MLDGAQTLRAVAHLQQLAIRLLVLELIQEERYITEALLFAVVWKGSLGFGQLLVLVGPRGHSAPDDGGRDMSRAAKVQPCTRIFRCARPSDARLQPPDV